MNASPPIVPSEQIVKEYKTSDDIEPDVEAMARQIIKSFRGASPDTPVQPGTPQIYGTPAGDVFSVAPGAELPLWRCYVKTARSMLKLVRDIDAAKAAEVASTAFEPGALGGTDGVDGGIGLPPLPPDAVSPEPTPEPFDDGPGAAA